MATIKVMYHDTGRIVEVEATPADPNSFISIATDFVPAEIPEGYELSHHSGHSDVGTISPTRLYFMPIPAWRRK